MSEGDGKKRQVLHAEMGQIAWHIIFTLAYKTYGFFFAYLSALQE